MTATFAVTEDLLLAVLMDGVMTGVMTGLVNVAGADPETAHAIAAQAVQQFKSDPAQRYELEDLVRRRVTGDLCHELRGITPSPKVTP